MGLKEMLMAAAESQADSIKEKMVSQLSSDEMTKMIATKINEKIDDLHDIIIKLIDAKNVMVDKYQELNDEVTDQLNYIEAKLGNGRGSKQKRKANKRE